VGHRRLAWTKNKLGQPTNSPNLNAIGLDSPEYFLRTAKFWSIVFPLQAIARASVKLSSGTSKEFLSPKFFGRVAGASKDSFGKKYFGMFLFKVALENSGGLFRLALTIC